MHHGVDHYSYMTGMRMVAADLLELESGSICKPLIRAYPLSQSTYYMRHTFPKYASFNNSSVVTAESAVLL